MQMHEDEGLIDLGEITTETKGPPAGSGDVIGQQQLMGLTDD